MLHGFVKVGAATPSIRVADCEHNGRVIAEQMREAAALGVKILVFPELCLTGATCGDLFLQPTLLEGAERALARLTEVSGELDLLAVVGLPARGRRGGRVYNCAAVLNRGRLLALVPKRVLSREELRWFSPGEEGDVPALLSPGRVFEPTLFCCTALGELTVAVELGDEPFALDPPARRYAEQGAVLLLNPAAAPALAGRGERTRRDLEALSRRLLCGYVRAGAGEGESTTDRVYDGHRLVLEQGATLAEGRFSCGITLSEIDAARLAARRRQEGRLAALLPEERPVYHPFSLEMTETELTRPVSPAPFLPEGEAARGKRCEELLLLAALGLKKRVEHTQAPCAVLGLSGGLDSTLALLTTARAFDLLGRRREDILAVTMPCFGTTARTRSNAQRLAEALGVTLKTVDITRSVRCHFADIGHGEEDRSVTYENAQARERTQVLMDLANKAGGLVIGTGDLSELALGWATYNGDHMSMYAVNASIPKTLVSRLVAHAAGQAEGALRAVLEDILATPVSPELLPPRDGEIAQCTEELVGPYELHDFFLYHTVRGACSPGKVLRLAERAFAGAYDRATLLKWLTVFCRRFFSQQFKRSCLPDGPGVGALSLSPRGEWAMPSDASARLWLEELEELT